LSPIGGSDMDTNTTRTAADLHQDGTLRAAAPPRLGVTRLALAALRSPIGVAAIILLLVGLWAYFQSGGVVSILPYLAGERIFLREPDMYFGRKLPGEVIDLQTVISNRSGRQLKLQGCQRECGCVSTDVFPLTIEAGTDRVLSFRVHLPTKEGLFSQRVIIYTDRDERSQFDVTLRGDVVAP